MDREKAEVIDAATAQRLRASLPPMSDRLYRDLLRASGEPLDPLVEGVRQDDFHHLERTLLELAQVYSGADSIVRKQVRKLVIEAKDHAKLAARNPQVDEARREEKTEMVLWLMTWLENPAVFELWVPMRKAHLGPPDTILDS